MQIAISRILKKFGRSVALDDASADIAGKVNLILGPNGSGKTTLLNVLAGLTYPERGILNLNGEEYDARERPSWRRGVERLRRTAGFLLDKPGLPSHLDGYEFLKSVAGSSVTPPDLAWIHNLVTRLGMSSFIRFPIGDYSSGMAQKLGIAASLVTHPGLVVWDEPTSNLDGRSRTQLAELVSQMVAEGTVFIIATHVSSDFEHVSDWIAVMELGRIISSGRLTDYDSKSPMVEAHSKVGRKLATSLVDLGLAMTINLVTPDRVVFGASEEGLRYVEDSDSLSRATGCGVQKVLRVRRTIAEIQAEVLQKEAEKDG